MLQCTQFFNQCRAGDRRRVQWRHRKVSPLMFLETANVDVLCFQRENEQGIFILDSRNKVKNVPVAHGIFTMKFSAHGTGYDHLAELPLFGHSENHAMLQLADWVGSAFLCPMAVRSYYPNLENVCVHADAVFDIVRNRFGQRIKALQYRYERDGHKLGGVSVLAGGNNKVSPVQVFGAKSP